MKTEEDEGGKAGSCAPAVQRGSAHAGLGRL